MKTPAIFRSHPSAKGFTIVELLIVIVVIGILAAITIVSYNSVQNKARTAAKVSELVAWQKLFELYKANNGSYPTMPIGGYCLGSFANYSNKCNSYASSGATTYYESASVPLMNELKTVGNLPRGLQAPVNGTVGPYVEYSSSGLSINLLNAFNGNTGECPNSYLEDYTDNAGRIICRIRLVK